MAKLYCGSCRFYEKLGDGTDGNGNPTEVGSCMRYPPQHTASGNFAFPVVGPKKSWCGEHVRTDNRPATVKPKGARK